MGEIQTTETGLTPEEMELFFGEKTEDNIARSFGAVKVMRETGQFELPSGQLVDSIEGYVLHSHSANAYWAKKPEDDGDGGTAPPDCKSDDGIKPDGGEDRQCTVCATCPQNQYDSAPDSKGKACKNTIKMLILMDNEFIPVILAAPPTSIGPKGSLMKWMNVTTNQVGKAYTEFNPKIKTSNGAPITERYLAHVRMTLTKVKYSGKVVSVIEAETINVLLPDASGIERLRYIHSIKKDAIEAYRDEISRYGHSDTAQDIPF